MNDGRPGASVPLSPLSDVAPAGPDRWIAASDEPWLGLPRPPGRWIRLRYRTSLLDDPVRPVLRIATANGGERTLLLPGPILGSAEWLGLLPGGARALAINPVAAPGPFGFAIDRLSCPSPGEILQALRRADRGRLRSAALLALIGKPEDAAENLRWALEGAPLEDWSDRRAAAAPLPTPEGSDSGPPILPIGPSADAGSAVAEARSRGAWLMRLPPGARLDEGALPALSACAQRHPEALALYADHEAGSPPRPVLKPGWSPLLEQATGYAGPFFAIRADALEAADLAPGASWPPARLLALPRGAVAHCRRIAGWAPAAEGEVSPASAQARPAVGPPSATIVIPTRNRAALLGRCIETVRATAPASTQVVVVDNGSREPDALALLARLRALPEVVVAEHPGPFNFSALCNAGARLARPGPDEVLIFLNNDIEATGPGWVEALADFARRPGVGAVGARLLYPDGRVQHAGVVVGMGGSCGHFDAGAPADDAGWLGRSRVAHEASAVTGACLAVRRDRFDAVGGFDEANLPVEFGDIDLCLKLDERGYGCIWTPDATLIHAESASRGRGTFRYLAVHARERTYFQRRWARRLRDDPCFHPGLSLYRPFAALG